MSKSNLAVECEGLAKKYGGRFAVRDANVAVKSGEVHALVGENGAGKSTLLGMISGRVSPDHGMVRVFGEELTHGSPREARAHGLAVVYQELTMVPTLTASQNMFLGQVDASAGFLKESQMRAKFVAMCKEFEVVIDPDTLARNLSVSQQQIVEILRGVHARGRVLMLDEPSAALAEHEREILYRILNRLRSMGTTIIFVSHNLDEVLELSDTVTVLRDGEVVTSAPRSEWDKDSLVRSMIGKDVLIKRRDDRHELGHVSISVKDVKMPEVVNGIGLTARSGEIVGLWGLVGSGRTTFMRSIAGLEPRSSGHMELGGRPVGWSASARESIRMGISLVPESRKQALVLTMNSVDNYWLGRKSPARGWLSPKLETADATPTVLYFGFNPSRMAEPVGRLSGGNQQKVLLAKWAGRAPQIFMVDEPTRGIDVGAKAEVLSSLVTLAKEGATVIMTSSELEEVLAICDRLLVFSHGRIVREIDTANNPFSVGDIVKFGFGEDDAS